MPARGYAPITNLFGKFLDIKEISNFNSPRGTYAAVGKFGDATISASGDSIVSYFLISGNYDTASAYSGSIEHDDGASLYVDGTAVFASPNETAAVTNSFMLPAGHHHFDLAYVEANGAPSVLDVNFPGAVTVPAPASVALLGAGLISLGMVRRKRS